MSCAAVGPFLPVRQRPIHALDRPSGLHGQGRQTPLLQEVFARLPISAVVIQKRDSRPTPFSGGLTKSLSLFQLSVVVSIVT